ncbi:MAG TPA: alpha/beta hydrolase [Trichocoleus sp.]
MKSSRESTPRAGRLKLDSGTLFWHEYGQGKTIVFLHGSWQDSLQWSPVIAALGTRFHCLAPDLLGFGESRSNHTAYSIALQVEALAAFLRTLRVSQCVLVGHSLGAWVATQFALKYPHQVENLVVIAPEGLDPTVRRKRWWLHRQLAGRHSLLMMGLGMAAPLIKFFGGQDWLRHTLSLRQQLRQFPAACRILFKRRSAEIRGEMVQLQLPQLQVPATVLLADTPDSLEQTLSKAFFSALPTATIRTIPRDNTAWGMALEPTIAVLTELPSCREAAS